MESIVKGKKLLILGGSTDELTIVERAQKLGVYVIVTDYFTDYSLSPAKIVADEAWDDDWTKVDLIVKKCKQHNIDGVTAGYSEIKIEYLIKICEKLKFPCYATSEQLEITRDKIKFKDECRKCNVPTVKEYASILDVDEFPVIVKPTDRAGSIGVSIANNYAELEVAYKLAMKLSLQKRVIIEKYMTGTKVDIYYGVIDNKIYKLSTCDTVMSVKNQAKKVIQDAWIYPHRNDQKLLKEELALQNMIKDMGISNGCIFFSGFYDEENSNYTFFECGFRLEGGCQYNYTEKKGPFNFLDLFIYHALIGSAKNISFTEKNKPNLKQVTVNYYAREGTIREIKGFDTVAKMPDCILSLVDAKVGEECYDNQAILTKVGMFSIAGEDSKQLEESVRKAMNQIVVLDENGNDMIYSKFDYKNISDWWNKV